MTNRQTEDILEIIHNDLCNPMQTITPGNKRYVLTMIDYDSYRSVFTSTQIGGLQIYQGVHRSSQD